MDARAEITELETRFWQTMVDKDVDTAVTLLADTCIVTGAQGAASIDKQAFATMMAGGGWELKAFSVEDIQFSTPAPGVAVIAYKVKEDLVVDGKPLTLTAADSSVWVDRDGKWVCALHTESVLGDPFGRDRTAD